MDKNKLKKAKEDIDKLLEPKKDFPLVEFKNILEAGLKEIKPIDNTEILKSISEKLERLNRVKKVEVINPIKIPDIPEFTLPKEFEVKEPKWYKPFVFPVEKLIEGFKNVLADALYKAFSRVLEVDLDKYTVLKNPLAVRLVSADLSRFYTAGGSGGGGNYGSGVSASNDNVQKATVVTETTVTLTLANTQYTYVLPANLKALSFRMRSGNYDLRYAYEPLAGGNYRTLPAGASYNREGIDLSGKTLYLNCVDGAGEIIELELWV